MSDAAATREFLTVCVAMIRQNAAKRDRTEPHYFGPMDLVLREGEIFTPRPYEPERWRFEGTPRNCFSDAFELAVSNPGVLTYVEGYAASDVLPGIHHADGNVADPTWHANGHVGEEYLGIRFPNNFILDVFGEKGTYGLLDWEPLWRRPLAETV